MEINFSLGKDPSKNTGARTGIKKFEHNKDGINIYVSPGSGSFWNGSGHSYYKICYISMNILGTNVYCTIFESYSSYEKIMSRLNLEESNLKKFTYFKNFIFESSIKKGFIVDILQLTYKKGISRGKSDKIKELKNILSIKE